MRFALLFFMLIATVFAQIDRGLVEFKPINEASGLDHSLQNANVLWTHNDSGDTSRIFALDTRGNHLGTYLISDIQNIDWEDITLCKADGKDVSHIYVADIGDNASKRKTKQIYKIPEPKVSLSQNPKERILKDVQTLTFMYPDGQRDAETFMSDPLNGDLYIVSKREERVHVYRFPGHLEFDKTSASKPYIPEHINTLHVSWVVGGDISEKGVLLKTYEKIYFWPRYPGQSIQDVLKNDPVELPYIIEPQGEAICWNNDGSGYYTMSEEPASIDSRLYYYPFPAEEKQKSKYDGQLGKIAFGPYLQNMTSNSVTVCWSTLESVSTLIDSGGHLREYPQYAQHSMPLTRLKAKSSYRYNISKTNSHKGTGLFTTFTDKKEHLKFAVLGDTRSRHKIHRKIVKNIMAEKPAFVINTGDLVGNGGNIHDWERFFEVNNDLMRFIPYFPVLGNHEKDSPYYFDFFELPGNERYYHFSVGEALFIILDSEGPEFQTPLFIKRENRENFWNSYNIPYFNEQKSWLEKVLSLHNDAGYIFVFMHKPLYSIKKSRLSGTKLNREFWGDIFDRHQVQAILNGHDHHYHHAINNGIHYITTAGGGAGLYETDAPQPQTVKFEKIEHYVSVEIHGETATLKAIDINKKIIETITIKRRNSLEKK